MLGVEYKPNGRCRLNSEASFADYREAWQRNADIDPLWAILTSRDKTGRRWEPEAFFATGRDEIARVFRFMARRRIAPEFQRRFLDFGCGVGRASRALIERFDSGIGVDISTRMIDLARQYSAFDSKQTDLQVVESTDLDFVPDQSIDFVYCHLVLQHMPPKFQRAVISELLRVLARGGVAAFQTPTAQLPNVSSRLPKEVPNAITIEMHTFVEAEVKEILRTSACHLFAAPFTNSTDANHCGQILFMSEAEAVAAVRDGRTGSRRLSQFFFVGRSECNDTVVESASSKLPGAYREHPR